MIRKKKSSSAIKTPRIYTIGEFKYKSKALADFHRELSENHFVKNFELPTIGNEKDFVNKKYHAYKPIINGIQFDSIMESQFYLYLLKLKKDHEIKSFERQKTFELQPSFKTKKGKTVRSITYVADFVVIDKNGITSAVDVKGVETDTFKIKKKLFQYRYPDICFLCLRWVPSEGQWLELQDIPKRKKK